MQPKRAQTAAEENSGEKKKNRLLIAEKTGKCPCYHFCLLMPRSISLYGYRPALCGVGYPLAITGEPVAALCIPAFGAPLRSHVPHAACISPLSPVISVGFLCNVPAHVLSSSLCFPYLPMIVAHFSCFVNGKNKRKRAAAVLRGYFGEYLHAFGIQIQDKRKNCMDNFWVFDS